MDCEVCDQPGASVVMLGYWLHEECAPAYWKADHRKREQFMAAVHALAPKRAAAWAKRDERKR